MAFLSHAPHLALYIARTFAAQIALVLAALLTLVLTVDVLGESNALLAQGGAGGAPIWTYLTLRLPVLGVLFAPFAILLAALTTVATLAYTGQVVAMKASGLSTGQITVPMVAVGLVCALAHFAFNQFIATPAAAHLDAWRAEGYGPYPIAQDPRTTDLWVDAHGMVVHATTATRQGDALALRDVTVFQYGDDGALVNLTRAARGHLAPTGSVLEDVEDFDIAANAVTRRPSAPWPLKITPADFFEAVINPDHVGVAALYGNMRAMTARGQDTGPLVAALNHKFARPLACAIMPLFAALAASSFARTGSVLLRSAAALLFGFGYFIADSVALAMARTGALPPDITPWCVLGFFLLISQTIQLRVSR